jgi:hypothetical protein
MSDKQLDNEYNRILATYERALIESRRYVEAELASIQEARTMGYRFSIRHGLLDLADVIATTDTKLSVFSNLVWEPSK